MESVRLWSEGLLVMRYLTNTVLRVAEVPSVKTVRSSKIVPFTVLSILLPAMLQ